MIPDIALANATEPVTLRVAADRFPQSVAGVVWRYGPTKTKEGKAGLFSTDAPTFTLGVPATVLGRYFLVEGAVLQQNDNPPTPFMVDVTIAQGQSVLFDGPPPVGGTGTIGNQDEPVRFSFRLVSGTGGGGNS